MIVKQISLDIEVDKEDVNLELIIVDLLMKNGFSVLGSNQDDISAPYNNGECWTKQ